MNKKSVLSRVVFVCLLSLVVVGAAEGAVITVKADGTGDYPTIQAAIDAAAAGDEVVLESGTYTGDGNRDIDFLGKAITVRSTEPNDPDVVSATIIDCQGSSYNPHRGFYFHSGEGTDSVLDGLTITGGVAPVEEIEDVLGTSHFSAGGGIFCENSSPTIRNCVISGNHAPNVRISEPPISYEYYGRGGGIYCSESSPTITSCVINNNSSTYRGGGICSDGGNPTISHCSINSNSVSETNLGFPNTYSVRGGGISCGQCTITDCSIVGNRAIGTITSGGGIYAGWGIITNCTIIDNHSSISGGGIYAIGCTITGCTISDNFSNSSGGGANFVSCSVSNCTIAGNRVIGSGSGGGISCCGETVVTRCEVTENMSSKGGGVYCGWGEVAISRCKVIDNTAMYYPFFIGFSLAEQSKDTTKAEFFPWPWPPEPPVPRPGVDYFGGGIYCGSEGTTLVEGCLIARNEVIGGDALSTAKGGDGYGGGIVGVPESTVIKNSVIVANKATGGEGSPKGQGYGGGVCSLNGDTTVTNCVVWANTALNGSEVAVTQSTDPATLVVEYSDISGGEAGVYIGEGSLLEWQAGNIEDEPLVTPDGHLQGDSPCINSGDPNYIPEPNETDVDGEVRVHGGRIDIGADEFIDMDGDGLPDWWEEEYFGDPTAANPEDDPDGDGCDNLTEYNNSRNPLVHILYYVNPVDGNDSWDGLSAEWDGVHGPKATIQSAIDATESEEGTVILSAGTYLGDGNRDIDFKGKAITVRSTNPDDVSVAAGTVIDCEGTYEEPHRGFNFVSGEGPGSVLSGVTIMNGYAPEEEFMCGDDEWEAKVGGGIFCVESSPTITKCVIKENMVGYEGGDGIFAACGSPTVSGCTITGNSGGGIRGADCNFNITGCRISGNSVGIFCYGSDWSVTDCTITGNSGVGILCGGLYPDGGKVLVSGCVISDNLGIGIESYDHQGQTTITDCIISGNGDPEEDHSEGGGVGGSGSEDDLISNCIITGNRAMYGGGIANWHGTISNCTISDNVAERGGGGLYYCEGTIESCVIRGNRTIDDGYGGGISHFQGEIRNCVIVENEATYGGGLSGVSSIKNCTIVDNYAFNGGGIYSAGAVTIANSILRGNGASYGSQLYLKRDVGSTATVSFTDFEDSEDGVYIGAGATLNWGEGNIDAEPWFALDGDYHLMPGSPCIDGGDPNYVSGPNDVDFEGKVRVMGEAVDMGVYEFCPNSPAIAVSGRRFSFYPEWPEREGQEMQIRNCGDEPLYWEIIEDCSWLEVVPASGVSEGEIDTVTITVDPNGLLPGLYRYTFEISDPNASNSPVGIEVTMPVGSIIEVLSQSCSTIQCAIDAAEEYDIVLVADGVYSGEGNNDLDFGGKAIAVCSENGPEDCVIDYSGSWGFFFQNFEGADSMVKGFTMRGAPIYCRKGSPTIKDCVVTETTGYNSGGITCGSHLNDAESHPTIVNCVVKNNLGYGIGGGYGTKIINCIVSGNEEGGIVGRSLTVEDCEITDNGHLGSNGGLSCIGGLSRISNCTIIGNEGGGNEGGGGISLSGHTTITDCVIMRNLSGGGGGGICCRWRGKATIRGCTISWNTVETAEGGGIYCEEGDVEIFNSIITGNRAKRRRSNEGGGIWVSRGNLVLTNCVVSGNEARGEVGTAGGGIWFDGESLGLKGCTVSGNFSDDMGGGIYCECDDLTIENCILWGNEGLEGPQMYLYIGEEDSAYIGYTNLEGGEGDFHIEGEGTLNWGEGNMDANPGFAFDGDWHLVEGSVCIDSGDPNYTAEVNEVDIEGNERVLDGDGDGNSVVDMGADEFNPWAATIAVSPKEFSFYYIQDWLKPEPQALQIRNCGGEPLYWEIVEDCNWLEVVPPNGVSEGEIDEVVLYTEPNLLEAGVYNCSLEVVDVNDANNIVAVDVRLCVGVLLYVPSVDCPTIQCAIDAAEDYDMVLVGDGVYTGEGNRDLDFNGKAITVKSENGSEGCIIDCEDTYIGFNFHNWEEDESIVDGFSIVDGNRGIYCDRSSPMISNCVISGHYGSGVFSKYSQSGLKLSGCLIKDNSTEDDGGGVHVEKGNLEISNCRVVGNTGKQAAGIYCRGTSIINGCTVEGNHGHNSGGIYCYGIAMISGCNITANTAADVGGGLTVHGKAIVVNCEIADNSAPCIGGIYCGNIKGRIENCIIRDNTTSGAIGGVYFGGSHNGGPVMANCLITGNKSLGLGTGGVGCMGGTISNCTIVGNSALNLGGAVTCTGDVNILNCIMWGNESPAGSEIYSGNEGVTFVSYSDVDGGEGSVHVEPNSVLEWGFGNMDIEPGFVEAGYWDANGTPGDVNDDFWVDGDYHLLEGSACINAGDPNYAAGPGETDLDGNERVVDGRIDMGAYEAGLPAVAVEVIVTPAMLNCVSEGNWVKAHVILPEGYWPEDIDMNTPAVAEPMGVESEYIKVFDNGKGKYGVEIGFDREAFCAAGVESEDGYLDVTVRGQLLTGQPFEGTDTIKVVSRRWRHRERTTTIRRGVREIRGRP